MAKRMASSAEERNTSSSTRRRKKYLMTLRSKLVGLRVASMARRCDCSALNRRGFLYFSDHSRKSLVFPRWIGNYHAHKIQPDGQSRMAPGLAFSQILFFVEAYPHAASQAGGEAHKPCVGVVIGSAGLARHRMVEFLCAACSSTLHHFFKERYHRSRRALADYV